MWVGAVEGTALKRRFAFFLIHVAILYFYIIRHYTEYYYPTLSDDLDSFFLIHVTACCCGSMQSG